MALGDVFIRLHLDNKKFNAALKTLKTDFKKSSEELASKFENSFDAMKEAGTQITAIGATMAVGMGVAVKTAADFEKQLSSIKAVSGATSIEMKQLRELAMKMGADTSFSAKEAAAGIEELIKAGVSTTQIRQGGLKGALDLAAAGEIELAEAAEIASTALNAFRRDNLTVSQAADILAGAANASATGVQELKFGLSQVAAVASGAGLSFKDTATAIALFAQNGLKGSDAGTSLKAMLVNLQPRTKDQITLFAKLGLTAKDGSNAFFDASGKLKGIADISEILKTSLGGLTDQQRLQAMETLFGTDAMRASNILFKEGANGANAMADAMGKVTASDVAKEKLNNLAGATEELKGSFETAAISIGTALIPAIRIIADGVKNLINAFNSLPGPLQQVIAIFGAALTVLTAVGGPILFLVGSLPALSAGFAALGTTLGITTTIMTGGLNLAIPALIAGITGLIAVGIALVANWNNIKNTAKAIWEKGIAQSIKDSLVSLGKWMIEAGKNLVKGLWEGIKNMAGWFKNNFGDWCKNVIAEIKRQFQIKSPSKVTEEIGKNLVEGFSVGIEENTSILTEELEGLSNNLTLHFKNTFSQILQGNMSFAQGFRKIMQDIKASFADMVASLIAEYIKMQVIKPLFNIGLKALGLPLIGTGVSTGLPIGQMSYSGDFSLPQAHSGGMVIRPNIPGTNETLTMLKVGETVRTTSQEAALQQQLQGQQNQGGSQSGGTFVYAPQIKTSASPEDVMRALQETQREFFSFVAQGARDNSNLRSAIRGV